MPIDIFIDNGSGNVNYAKYVVSLSIDDNINLPTTANFTLTNIDNAFVIPKRNAYVTIYSRKYNTRIATGFITQSPQERYIGSGPDKVRQFRTFEWDIAVTSDEWLLNVKSLPFQPALVNQTMGQIIRTLTQTLVPNYYNLANVNEGDIVPIFTYDPRQKWSEIVKTFADGIRYRYKVINRDIIFKPYGDAALGISYNDKVPPNQFKPHYFDPYALNTQLLNVQPVNDVTVVGSVEAGSHRDDYFIGNGFEGNYPLRHKMYKGASALLLKEDWSGNSFATDLWTLKDTGPFFIQDGALNVQGGLGSLDTTYIKGNNGVELAGQLLLEHGEITFNNTSKGIVGGLYVNSPFVSGNCMYGFDVRPSVGGVVVTASGASGIVIQPMVSGALVGQQVITKANHNYFVQTMLTSKRASRYNKVYRTLAGLQYGGDEVDAPVDVTFIISDIDLAHPLTPDVTKYSQTTNPPAFAMYLPLNSENLNLTLSSTVIAQPPQATLTVKSLRGPTGAQLPVNPPGSEQSYLIGFGSQNQTATVAQSGDVDTLQFYVDTVPAVGARIRLQSWEAKAAVARVKDSVSIASEAVVSGDNGIRAATITDLNPLPRTSEECETAAQVIIKDRNSKQVNGSYTFIDDYLDVLPPVDYPRSGRYFNVSASDRGIVNESYLVRKVSWQMIELFQEKIQFTIEFGQDQYLNKLISRFIPQENHVLTSLDTSRRPDIQDVLDVGVFYLDDLADVDVTSVAGTGISVYVKTPIVGNVEVRRIDTGWGVNDQNRVGTFLSNTFTLPRLLIDQTYYMRMINGDQRSRRSRVIRVNYPLVPSAPLGALDVRDWLKPEIHLQIAGDIRNIYGIEIRSCMTPPAALSVSGALSVTGAQVTGVTGIENPMECLDIGLIADDPSNNGVVAIGNQDYRNTRKRFTRSEFYFDHSLFDVGTEFYFEAVVTNASFTENREMYIEKQMRNRTPASPVIVQTLIVPPQCHRRRIRFQEEFLGFQYDQNPSVVVGPTVGVTGGFPDYSDTYMVWVQAQAPPTLVYGSITIPSSSFELHSLKLIAVHVASRKTVIEIPLSAMEKDSNEDFNAPSFMAVPATGPSTPYDEFPCGSLWQYNAADWDQVVNVTLTATMGAVAISGKMVCALYDNTAGIIVAGSEATVIASVNEVASCAVASFNVSGKLIDGHEYTPRIRTDLPSGVPAKAYFYKARLRLALYPLRKANVYWRATSSSPSNDMAGVQPYKTYNASTFPLTPGALQHRFQWNPDLYSFIRNVLFEVTGKHGSGLTTWMPQFGGIDWYEQLAGGATPAIKLESFITFHASSTSPYMSTYVNGSAKTDLFAEMEWIAQYDLPSGNPAFHVAGITLRSQNGGLNADYGYAVTTDLDHMMWTISRYFPQFGGYGAEVLASGVLSGFVAGTGVKIRGEIVDRTITAKMVKASGVTSTLGTYTVPALEPSFLASGWTGIYYGGGSVSGGGITYAMVKSMEWTNWKGGIPATTPCALVNAGTHDGAKTALPGWFGYLHGDHIPCQNYTVDPNFATALNKEAAIVDKMIDDYMQAKADVMMAAWQFELFVNMNSNSRSIAGKTEINSLRNVIISQQNSLANVSNDSQKDWIASSLLTFSGDNKEIQRAIVTGLIAGNRYFGSLSNGIIQALLVVQIQAINESELAQAFAAVPDIIERRVFKAPQDLNFVFDNVPYRVRDLCFNAYFFNLMWEYSPPFKLTRYLQPVPTPKVEIVSVMAVDVQVRLDIISVEDTVSVSVEMSNNSEFLGKIVRVKGGPLQSVYNLRIPGGIAVPVVGQYIRAKRKDYLGDSDWSPTVFVSADEIKNSTLLPQSGASGIVSNPLSGFLTYQATATSITWSWTEFSLTFPDGFVQHVAAGSYPVFTGLTQLTTYKFYPYLQDSRQANAQVIIKMSSSGTNDDPAALALMSADQHVPLSIGAMIGTTAATSKTVVGSGGGVSPGGSSSGAVAIRKTSAITTASLVNNDVETSSVSIAKAFDLIKVQASAFCRIRLYSSAAARTADAARAASTPIAVGTQHGLITELMLQASGDLTWTMSPPAYGAMVDDTVNVPYAIQNLSGSTQAITVTFTYISNET